MTPFFKSKFFKFFAFMLALVAVSTPFWLFNSDQSIVTNSNPQPRSLNQDNVVASKDSQTTGTIELSSLNKASDPAPAPTSSNQASSPTKDLSKPTNTKEKISSNDKSLAKDNNQEATTQGPIEPQNQMAASSAPSASSSSQNQTGQNAASVNAAAQSTTEPSAASQNASLQSGAGQSVASSSVAAQDANKKDSTKSNSDSSSMSSNGTLASMGNSNDQKAEKDQGTEQKNKNVGLKSEHIKDQVAMKNKDEKSSSSNSNILTDSVEHSSLTEQVLATKEELKKQEKQMTLAQKVKALTDAQTKEQKAQYQRSIEERQEMVDAAIASIAQNSKMYLPPIISSRALVVTFSVPIANANLSGNKDHGVDATTGATLIKYENSVDGPMSFIAQRLNKESGADLYFITPTIQYPKKQNKLYQFALEELTNKNYPELTDDVPLHLENYDTIYLCYPLWWDDLPAAVYSFLIKYDLSDKNIIPVCLHSGDDFSNTISTIITYEPHAIVYKSGLSISTKESLNSNYINNKIRVFLSNLAVEFN